MALARSKSLPPSKYAANIAKGLDAAFDPRRRKRWWMRPVPSRQEKRTVEAADLKIAVFSDLHRGMRDRADDFRRSHRAYRAALGWYLEHGYELWLLGDVEELWENGSKEVLEKYGAVLDLEKEFLPPNGPGYRRFYGNHDLDWSNRKRVKELKPWLGDTPVLESLRLQITENGRPLGMFFFVHGHQGTPGSDVFAFASRFVVRVVWRAVQRSQGWVATTPAENPHVRGTHDNAMADWAKGRASKDAPGERPILVAGHTHHPVFADKPPTFPTEADLVPIQAELDAAQDPAERAAIRARLQLKAAVVWEKPRNIKEITPPVYFNTGCCSFPDGDITCLEISGETLVARDDPNDGRGKIRLVRWLDNDGGARPRELAAKPLREVLAAVNG